MHNLQNLTHEQLISLCQKKRSSVDFFDWLKISKLDLRGVWEKCERGDWMLWIAEESRISERILIGIGGECAASMLHRMTHPDSIAAVHACAAYYRGEIGDRELSAVQSAARDAAIKEVSNSAAFSVAYAIIGSASNCAWHSPLESAEVARKFIKIV